MYVLFFFFGGATARGGPWPPLQYASKPLDPLLCLSVHLFPSFSGPWTRHPAISFLVFLFVLLHIAFCTKYFLGLRCLAFFLYDQDFTGPYIFRKIFLSNTANALSSSMVSVHDSEPEVTTVCTNVRYICNLLFIDMRLLVKHYVP